MTDGFLVSVNHLKCEEGGCKLDGYMYYTPLTYMILVFYGHFFDFHYSVKRTAEDTAPEGAQKRLRLEVRL